MNFTQRLELLIQALGNDHKNQQNAIAGLLTKMGSLPNLTTTTKTSLVAAINEIKAQSNSGANIINDTASSSATKTYSIDKIKLEIEALKQELLGGVPATTFDTLKEISDYLVTDQSQGTALATAVANRVSYTSSDNRTVAEKQQARQNIDAVGNPEFGDVNADLLAMYNQAKA